MIKSHYFWLAALMAALIPFFIIDIVHHYLDWKKEVREELIIVVQNLYTFTKAQKANILDRVFERNQTLMFLMYFKSFVILLFMGGSSYFFWRYQKQEKPKLWKPLLYTIGMVACFLSIKIFVLNRLNSNENVRLISINPNTSSFEEVYNNHFKGSVVYVDFWGTTCGPCLQEFRNFTKPLKEKYRTRNDIKYLYVAQGNEYLWREQIKKYNVEGNHIFIGENQYANLYRQSTKDSTILMPRYLIIDKKGKIVEANAKKPSDRDSLYLQLELYLAEK